MNIKAKHPKIPFLWGYCKGFDGGDEAINRFQLLYGLSAVRIRPAERRIWNTHKGCR